MTSQEIRDLLDQLVREGQLRRTPIDFVFVDVLRDLNERLAAVESTIEHQLELSRRTLTRIDALDPR